MVLCCFNIYYQCNCNYLIIKQLQLFIEFTIKNQTPQDSTIKPQTLKIFITFFLTTQPKTIHVFCKNQRTLSRQQMEIRMGNSWSKQCLHFGYLLIYFNQSLTLALYLFSVCVLCSFAATRGWNCFLDVFLMRRVRIFIFFYIKKKKKKKIERKEIINAKM